MSVPGYSPGFKAPGLYIREDRAVGPSNGRNLVRISGFLDLDLSTPHFRCPRY
ncbi:hypothetical protein ASPTUDRAFT_39439 [Aspergillus tubingensis CBS 134.48]|uniref:Uncharacterized protein n=1 Tax=Aspergillus tubingensis (strain CBS 134.48) TaxID=767770 RepID=A0A1L9NB89_ASPTC|nr:hypothetical protein ASPTUDRAFT_39439 [Aspergillus tubingensis CBS 134.48]